MLKHSHRPHHDPPLLRPIPHPDPAALPARQRRSRRPTNWYASSLDAIEASQSTLNAFRVVLTEQALADAAEADRKRAAGTAPSAARHPDRGQGRRRRRGRAHPVRHRRRGARRHRRRRGGAPAAGGGRGDRRQDQHLRARPVAVHQRPGLRAHPQPVVGASTPPAVRRAAAPPRWPPGWSPPPSAPTARAASASPRRGPTSSASNRSAAGSPPGRCPRRSTASPSTACWPAPSPTPRWCSTPPPATSTATCTSRRRSALSEYVGQAPGPLTVAMSTKFPFTVFRAKLHPEIRRRMDAVAGQLEHLGHTVTTADPDYGLRMSWNFLSRSTSGLLDWADRLGHGVDARQAHREQYADGPAAVRAGAAQGPRRTRPSRSAGSGGSSTSPTWCWRRPPRSRRRGSHDFDRRGGLATDRAMIRGLPGDLAVEPARLAVDQHPRRFHLRRPADRRAADGPGEQRAAADLAGRRAGGDQRLGEQAARAVVGVGGPSVRIPSASRGRECRRP